MSRVEFAYGSARDVNRRSTSYLPGAVLWGVLLLGVADAAAAQVADKPYVRVSLRDPHYFELSDGRPYIPIGLNMIAPPGGPEKEALAQMETWLRRLSENGGNFIRLWLSHDLFDVEPDKSGVYDEKRAERIRAVLALARQHNLRVKMTLEHFRPIRIEHPRLRIYALSGRHMLLGWCRDAENTWRTELAEGKPPEDVKGQSVALPQGITPVPVAHVHFYDPWTDTWSDGKIQDAQLSLPGFRRSLVFRIER